MKTKASITGRAPSIGNEYNVRISLFSNSTDTEPKMSIALAGNYRVNLLRLAIGVVSVATIVISAVSAAKFKKRSGN